MCIVHYSLPTLQMYEHEHHKSMTSDAIAAMISTMLYYRRFFPYYVYNIVGGLDEEGETSVLPQKVSHISHLQYDAVLQPLLPHFYSDEIKIRLK